MVREEKSWAEGFQCQRNFALKPKVVFKCRWPLSESLYEQHTGAYHGWL